MKLIKISIRSDKKVVKNFLTELKEVLDVDDFSIEANWTIIKSNKDEVQYSTSYTMLDLEYDSSDIVERLNTLVALEMLQKNGY